MQNSPHEISLVVESQCKTTETATMKLLLLVATLLATVSCLLLKEGEWEAYKKKYKKHYDAAEDKKRLEQYRARKRLFKEHNNGPSTYKMGVNHFTDMYENEITTLYAGPPPLKQTEKEGTPFRESPGGLVPPSINWVEKGAVTKVKNQKKCGGSYAFSAAGALEGLMFTANQPITDLSVQELLDCPEGNFGCQWGTLSNCFDYVKHHHGIATADSYPFIGKKGKCRADGKTNGTTCHNYEELKTEKELKAAVGDIGPAAIVFRPSLNYTFYEGGIYDGPCQDTYFHSLLVVGYDNDDVTGEDYWLVKNSWSEDWGENGYGKVIRNKNLCGFGDSGSIPTFFKPRP